MARASTKTFLPLDTWAELMNYDRYHFNNIFVSDCKVGENCGAFWHQTSEQSDYVSRESLAYAIMNAEIMISDYVGYNLLPDWDHEELTPEPYYNPRYKSNFTTQMTPKSLQVGKRHLIDSGIMAKEILEEDVLVTRIDKDGDGFAETVQVFIDLSAVNLQEVRVYYPLEEGSDEWEIRPLKVYADRIEFPVWLIVKRQLIEEICPEPLDGKDDEIYLEEVDVYRVFNDTDVQARLIYHPSSIPCPVEPCENTVSLGNCVYINDKKLGYVVYNPRFLHEPDKVDLQYYSGWQGKTARPLVDIDPYWRYPIAYLAASLLDKTPRNCCGSNDSFLVSQWKDDLSLSDGKKSYFATIRQIENVFGISTKGAWFAHQRASARRLP